MKSSLRLSLLFLLSAAALFAGGPIEYLADGRALKQDASKPFVYHVETGALTANIDGETANSFVNETFAIWNAVPGSALQIQAGDRAAADIQTLDEINAIFQPARNTIVFDQDGSLFEEFGADSFVLAFTSHFPSYSTEHLGTGFVIFGGPAMSSFTTQAIKRIMVHEFGHLLGLGHSIVNGDLDSTGLQYETFGRPPANTVEIMYWSVSNGAASANQINLTRDDLSAYLALYGSHPQGADGMSAISGRLLMPDGGSPADGVNVVARDRSGGRDTVFANAVSRISTPLSGAFDITLLPPGNYSVEVGDLSERNEGAYSPPIRSNFNRQGNVVIGPFPGPKEFYNGASESNDPAVDDPTAMETVATSANTTATGIDIRFNREAGLALRGSGLAHVNTIAEVRNSADGSEQTWLGIVNTNNQAVTLDVYGFNDSGEVVAQAAALGSMPAFGKVWTSSADLFGAAAPEVTWIQVGSTMPVIAYAEIQNATVRSAYLGSENTASRTFMPHIAVDTAGFETVLSSVNVGENGTSASITRQPTGDSAGVDALALAYARESRIIQDYFPELGTEQIWAEINADQANVAAMEYFTRLPNRSQTASLGLNNQSGNTLQFLHVATDTGQFWTGMVYINVGNAAATVTETYYNAAGAVISSAAQPPLDAGGKVTLLFDANNQVRVPAGTSWVEVSADQPLIGYELFGTPVTSANDTFTGLQGNYSGGQVLAYPHFQMQGNTFTAIVATNLGDQSASMVFEAIGADGHVLQRSAPVTVNAKSKYTAVLDGLFPNAVTLAEGAWIRGVADGSTWAGFTLWGDHLVPARNYLSGITAKSKAVAVGNPIAETTEVHNTFETAQVLYQYGDRWDIQLVGNINDDDVSPTIVRIADGQGGFIEDDFEDIYTFTLDKPTALVIGVAPNRATTDLDMLVTNGPLDVSGSYGAIDNNTNQNFVYSAAANGDESLAKVFPAGTYYILVSYFEDGGLLPTDYGLVVTEVPLVLATFDDGTIPAGWSTLVFPEDADGQSNWSGSTDFSGSIYGNSLANDNLASAATERSAIVTTPFNVPQSGVTLVNFEVAFGSSGAVTPEAIVWIGSVSNGQFNQIAGGLQFTTTFLSTFPFRGGSLLRSFWFRHAAAKGGVRNELSLTPGQQNVSLGVLGQVANNILFIDNLYVVNIPTTLGNNKREGEVVLQSNSAPKFAKPGMVFLETVKPKP